jgi:hypothetical protein
VWKRFRRKTRRRSGTCRTRECPVKRIAKHLGRQNVSLRKFIADHGGRRPIPRERSELRLSLQEREEISRGLAAGLSIRAIAAGLGRSPSTVCREVNSNGGRRKYRALQADRAALKRASRPKRAKLSAGGCARRLNGSSRPGGHRSRSRRGWLTPTPTARRCRCPTRPSTSPSSSRAVVRCEKSCTRA